MNCPHCQHSLAAALTPIPKLRSTVDADQEAAMLAALRVAGAHGLTTDDFRAAGFYQVSARLWALRHRWGATIHTELYDGLGADQVWHCRMARYRLISEPLIDPSRRRPKKAAPQEVEGAQCR